MRYFIGIIFYILATFTWGANLNSVTGKISKVQLMGKNYQSYSTAGDAIVFIYMNSLPDACGSSGGFNRVAITSSHPAFNVVVSAALAAKAASQTVQLHYLEECTLWNGNAWDFAIITPQ